MVEVIGAKVRVSVSSMFLVVVDGVDMKGFVEWGDR